MSETSKTSNISSFILQVIIKLFALFTLLSSGIWLFYIYFSNDAWKISYYDDESVIKFKLLLIPSFVLGLLVLLQKFSIYKISDKQHRINALKKEIEIKELENKLKQLDK